MSWVVREYERLDPGHKGVKVNIVFNNIALYMQYKPDPNKPPLEGITAFCLNNGQVLACKVDIASVRQIFERMK